jgi:hypothetical protein
VKLNCFGLLLAFMSSAAFGQIAPTKNCDSAGIGSVNLTADAPVTVISIGTATAGTGTSAVPYCLVKVRVAPAVNIWVGLPMEGKWNGRLQSEGGGGYAGHVGIPTNSILGGYIGIQTDTGHVSEADPARMGDFGMLSPGIPNTPLQKDFAYRSEHLMAVIGKQLAQALYGRQPDYSYWNGCSTGGRQGLRMAQDFPRDYDGILAGSPAIHWDRFQAYQIWPQVVMKELAGGVIPAAKEKLATNAAVKACDAIDGVVDGMITDPRKCGYSAAADKNITKASCTSKNETCLTPAEATAIDHIWKGATNLKGELLWPGVEPGAPLDALAGPTPFIIATNQPQYWVYLNPTWDWHVLTLANYEEFFEKTVQMVGPLMATENPNLSAFRAHGGKMITWHGFNDPMITPQGSILYYDSVVKFFGENYGDVQQFYRLFMAPGVEHCGGGDAPQPGRPATEELPFAGQENLFQAVVNWVEHGQVPDRILASQSLSGGATRTRPLCPYPAFAKYTGQGSTDDAANFVCTVQ